MLYNAIEEAKKWLVLYLFSEYWIYYEYEQRKTLACRK